MKLSRTAIFLSIFSCMALFAGYYLHSLRKHKAYHAIIFDMDGTIIDTDHLWKKANRFTLDEHAPHLSHDQKEEIISNCLPKSIYEVWNEVEQHCCSTLKLDEIISKNIEHLNRLYPMTGIDFIPHFHEFHEKVIQHGLKSAVATSSEQGTVDIILDIVPLNSYFNEHIYNASHVKAYKPDPAVYLHAAKMLQEEPCHCIAIEDSSSGIKAAKAAGMYCIGINTGKNRKALELADEIVESFLDINLDKLLYTA